MERLVVRLDWLDGSTAFGLLKSLPRLTSLRLLGFAYSHHPEPPPGAVLDFVKHAPSLKHFRLNAHMIQRWKLDLNAVVTGQAEGVEVVVDPGD